MYHIIAIYPDGHTKTYKADTEREVLAKMHAWIQDDMTELMLPQHYFLCSQATGLREVCLSEMLLAKKWYHEDTVVFVPKYVARRCKDGLFPARGYSWKEMDQRWVGDWGKQFESPEEAAAERAALLTMIQEPEDHP